MKKTTIGFIGLGVMGTSMARNLAKAGYPLAVYDKKATLADRLSSEFEQVRAVESPKLVAEFSDIVTMLPTGNHAREVIRGKDGLIEGYQPGSFQVGPDD
jgi:3-hydroxyisobutyrate dehydrogenase